MGMRKPSSSVSAIAATVIINREDDESNDSPDDKESQESKNVGMHLAAYDNRQESQNGENQ